MWDVDLIVEEIHRDRQEGLPVDQLPRDAARAGLPELPLGHWDPMFQALSDTNMVLSLHIGAGFDVIKRPAEAPIDHLMVLACQISRHRRPGPALRSDPAEVPRSEGGAVRGRDRLDSVLHGSHRSARVEPGVARTRQLGRQEAVRGVPRAHPGVLHHRPVRAAPPRSDRHRQHRVGVRLPAHRHDLAELARAGVEASSRGPAAAKDEIDKITFENACRFFQNVAPRRRSPPPAMGRSIASTENDARR